MADANPQTGDPRVGLRRTSAMASIVAATTTYVLHAITPGRTAIIRKVMFANRNAATARLRIGSTDAAAGGAGGAYVQRLPEIFAAAGLSGLIPEEELPNYEFRILVDANTDIVIQSDIGAAAPNDIQVIIEVEEFGEQ